MAHEVFISHSSKNKATADAICHALEQNGVRCWIAPRDIQPGAQYGEQITKGIRECIVFLLVFSGEVNHSPAVQKELERAALGYKKTIIPFRIEDVPMNDNIEFFLCDLHWIDAYPNDAVFSNLVTAVRNTLGMRDGAQPAQTVNENPAVDIAESHQAPIPASGTTTGTAISSAEAISPKSTCITIGGETVDISATSLHLYNYEADKSKSIKDIRALADLTNLVQLNLGRNRIGDNDLYALANLTKLEELILVANPISDISALANLTKLRILDISLEKLSDISVLANLVNLTSLSVARTSITNISVLANLRNLKTLNLNANGLSDISPLANLTNLTELLIRFNSISDISALAKLANLTNLDLDINQIGDISALADLANLTILKLENNNINDIRPLYKLTNLSYLNLKGNPLTHEQIDDLQTALPNCTIDFD